MLTVWTICWGDKYSDYYVQRLQREVRKYLSIPHRFICITDRHIDGVDAMPFPENYPGWWSKVALFKVATAQNLWLDLDVVITGDLDPLVEQYGQCPFAAPMNWAQSGHGGIQSSVMIWADNNMARKIYDLFDPAMAHWPPRNEPGVLWGDQEWMTLLHSKRLIQWTPITEGIKSYKYHCRNGLPHGTSIVVFHGDPKPQQVSEPWFQW